MLNSINPMDVRLAFVRRLYLIDDTVLATVTLVPNGSVKIRRANLNLVAQARLTRSRRGGAWGWVSIRPLLLPFAFTLAGAKLSTRFPIRQYQDSTAQHDTADNSDQGHLSARYGGYRNRQSEATRDVAESDSGAPIGWAGKAGSCGEASHRLVHPRFHSGINRILDTRQERLDYLVLVIDPQFLPGIHGHSKLFVDIG